MHVNIQAFGLLDFYQNFLRVKWWVINSLKNFSFKIRSQMVWKNIQYITILNSNFCVCVSTAQFRALVLDEDLLPSTTTVRAEVRNPDNFVVFLFAGQSLNTGVYSSSLKIGSDAPHGEWTISIQDEVSVRFFIFFLLLLLV